MRFVLQLSQPAAPGATPTLTLHVDGRLVEVPDDGSSLLEVLRQHLGHRSPKDGCSPQGQCGCCTVWVDGAARVACVTPARRVTGRRVTTLEGLDPALRKNIEFGYYPSGHMIYLNVDALHKLKDDLATFIANAEK